MDCAVSGGADSLALMVLAVEAGLEVTAVHVDHGLRPGSEREAAVVANAAHRFGAAFRSVTAAVAPGPNLEARARAVRLAALPTGVLTGHTADDQAETILLNLMRGAGLEGLSGMARGSNHPLLALRRHETAQLCASLGLDPVQDPSNVDPRFRRNRVRHELLPLLCEVAGRDVVPVLSRQAEVVAEVATLLDDLTADVDAADTAQLRALPDALCRVALRRWFREETASPYPPDAAAMRRLLRVARIEARAADVVGGWRVERTAGRLRLMRARDDGGQALGG